ncbi:MAG TPA: PAS domain-containing protein [Candidatus Limnocylindrales bacterium]
MIVRADGTYVDANAPALDLLGMTLADLRAAKPGQFSAEPQDPAASAALLEQWASAGPSDLAGETTIVRPDGGLRRVRFVITRRNDDEYAVILDPLPRSATEETVVFTAGDVLAEWRAAERRLEAVPANSPEWQATRTQIDQLRDRYQRLFEARRGV